MQLEQECFIRQLRERKKRKKKKPDYGFLTESLQSLVAAYQLFSGSRLESTSQGMGRKHREKPVSFQGERYRFTEQVSMSYEDDWDFLIRKAGEEVSFS